MKDNIVTIILIFLIIIVLFGVGFFIYNLIIKQNNKNTNYDVNISDNEIEKKVITTIEDGKDKLEENQSKLFRIADLYNNCSIIKKVELEGYSSSALATNDSITISTAGGYVKVVFILDDNNILNTKILYDQNDPNKTGLEIILASILFDCVAQEKGYPASALFKTITNNEALNYTIDKEGVETRQVENSYDFIFRIDLNSDFPCIN